MRCNLTGMLLGVKLNANLSFFFQLINKLPAWMQKPMTPSGAKNMADLRGRIGQEIGQVIASPKDSQQTRKRSVLYDLTSQSHLQNAEELPVRLGQESTCLVMAGTESTAKSIGIGHFHMLANRSILSKVRMELSNLPPHAPIAALEQLPYLGAVVSEANRLSFGLTGRNARVAPDETIVYGSHVIPPGAPISMTTLSIHTDESVFPNPWTFDPDRWLGKDGKTRQKYNFGFGKGARRCLGANLANAELFLLLATVAQYDVELFNTDVSDVEFRHDYQVAHPRLDSKGIRVKVKGKIN